MKCGILNIFLFIGIFCHVLGIESEKSAVQIVTLTNDKYQLNDIILSEVFDRDDFLDREIVVVSITGPYRKGKSFLLNFFVKYLYAQVRNQI